MCDDMRKTAKWIRDAVSEQHTPITRLLAIIATQLIEINAKLDQNTSANHAGGAVKSEKRPRPEDYPHGRSSSPSESFSPNT